MSTPCGKKGKAGKKNSKGIKRKSEGSVHGRGGSWGPDEVRGWGLTGKNVGLVSRAGFPPTAPMLVPHRPGRAEVLGGQLGLQRGKARPREDPFWPGVSQQGQDGRARPAWVSAGNRDAW